MLCEVLHTENSVDLSFPDIDLVLINVHGEFCFLLTAGFAFMAHDVYHNLI